MKHAALPAGVSREGLLEWFRQGRERSAQLFEIPHEGAYYERPIPLRNPIVFYEGHLPAFTINTLVKLALNRPGISEDYEVLFARGIDPESERAAGNGASLWPSRAEVRAYGAEADSIIERALLEDDIDCDDVPPLRGGEAALAILEHEQMHQETLLYMFHNMPLREEATASGVQREASRRNPMAPSATSSSPSRVEWRRSVRIARPLASGGITSSGHMRSTWRSSPSSASTSRMRSSWTSWSAAGIRTNRSGRTKRGNGCAPPESTHPHFWLLRDGGWYWRGMFELIPLPDTWPVYVSHAEALAFARWRGMRLPTEAEYHRAAFGTPAGRERNFPWGDDPADSSRGNFDFAHWDPLPVGSFPAGASAWGVEDLVGNGWEWTSTPFDGFPGFEPMASYPVYSTDFFDRQHYVLKGASPATARHLIRRSFRNWFRPTYPYVYATFRCVA